MKAQLHELVTHTHTYTYHYYLQHFHLLTCSSLTVPAQQNWPLQGRGSPGRTGQRSFGESSQSGWASQLGVSLTMTSGLIWWRWCLTRSQPSGESWMPSEGTGVCCKRAGILSATCCHNKQGRCIRLHTSISTHWVLYWQAISCCCKWSLLPPLFCPIQLQSVDSV